MTAAELARIRASIDADERTLASNWPLARDRERLYLATATAVNLYGLACVTGINENNARGDMFRALAALAPASDAGHSERSPLQDHPMLPVFSAAMDAGAVAGEAGR